MMKPLVNLVKRTLLLILATGCGGVEVDFARSLAVRAPADIVLRSGKVITLDKEFSIREAVAIKDGRFLAVGSDREVRPLVGPGTRVIELAGRTVIPGLVDARIHATEACVQWNTQLHWQSTRTLVDALNQVAAAARTRPRGAWIVVGGGWVPTQFAERRFPTRAELDARAPDHPVYIQYLDEAALLNSAALRALQFASARPFISEGKIERHPKTGELTGWIQGAAWRLALDEIPQPTLDVARQSLRDCFRELLRFGITSIGDVQSSSVTFAHRRLLADLARAGELHPRVNFYVATSDAAGELDRLKLILEQIKTLGSHERIRFAGFSWSNGGAAAREPEFRRAVAFFAENGFNFQVHANGDQAIRPLVAALQEIHKVQPGMRRRIVFAGLDDVSPETAEQIKALGGGLALQGSMALSGERNLERWSLEQIRSMPPLRALLKSGIPLGIGSGAYRAASYVPMLSLSWLVSGKTITGSELRSPEQNLTREEALRLHTMGGAWLTLEEGRKGSIEVGKYADLAVLSADYLTVPKEQIRSIESLLTIVGGRVAHAAGPFESLSATGRR